MKGESVFTKKQVSAGPCMNFSNTAKAGSLLVYETTMKKKG